MALGHRKCAPAVEIIHVYGSSWFKAARRNLLDTFVSLCVRPQHQAKVITMRRITFLLLLLFATSVHASGPVAPNGWEGEIDPALPEGQPCCTPADLNGTKLIGGAFILLSTDKREFGIFALSYAPSLTERWQLLEKHPISEIPTYRVSIEPAGRFQNSAVKVCRRETICNFYYTNSPDGPFLSNKGEEH